MLVITFGTAVLAGLLLGRHDRLLTALGAFVAIGFWITWSAITIPSRGPDLTAGVAIYYGAIGAALLYGVWTCGVLISRRRGR